jgi:hypothetical protein
MAIPSVPNPTFGAGDAARASEVNANFTAIINGLKTGSTWDVVVSTLTTSGSATFGGAVTCNTTLDVTGATTLNGDVTLGDEAGDTITVTGTATFAETVTMSGAATVGSTLGITGTTTCAAIDASGDIDTDLGVSGLYFRADGDDPSAPGSNRLYKANIPKAWAYLDVGVAGSVTVSNDHNISSASWSSSILTVNIDTNMADNKYAAMVTGDFSFPDAGKTNAQGHAAGSFEIAKEDASFASANWASGNDASCVVLGDQ